MENIKLVAFDVFGTLADGNRYPGPYARISQELGVEGRELSNLAQTRNVSVGELIDLLAPTQPNERRRQTERQVLEELKEDLAQVFLFPETVAVLQALEARGIRTALVSNLAPPYAPCVKSILRSEGVLPSVCIWSFEVGTKKPEPAIYAQLFKQTGCSPHEILFVGDKADRDLLPPKSLGCEARLIARPSDRHYARAIANVPAADRIEDLRDIFSVLKMTPGLTPHIGQDRPASDSSGSHLKDRQINP